MPDGTGLERAAHVIALELGLRTRGGAGKAGGRVADGAVELKKTDTGEVVTRPADIVIMALGNRPDKSYEQQLKDAFDKVVFVGDANKGGTMADATLSAYENCWFF